jgi:hypothetical protein
LKEKTMMTPRPVARVFAVAFLYVLVTSQAAAETTQCTAITSLPYSIDVPGVYCLTDDLTTSISSGNAITINANSVTLDLNGHKLAGNAGATSTATGILADTKRYVVIKNGTIRGFSRAVAITGVFPDVTIVEDLIVDKGWQTGIQVNGIGAVVRRNRIHNVVSSGLFVAGILSTGTQHVIRDNDISEVRTTFIGGTSVGIDVTTSNSVVEGNRIGIVDIGVQVRGTNVLVSDNMFLASPTAIAFINAGTGKYRNNLTTPLVTTLATGGIDAGGNN